MGEGCKSEDSKSMLVKTLMSCDDSRHYVIFSVIFMMF